MHDHLAPRQHPLIATDIDNDKRPLGIDDRHDALEAGRQPDLVVKTLRVGELGGQPGVLVVEQFALGLGDHFLFARLGEVHKGFANFRG